jgi:hypothetical protein
MFVPFSKALAYLRFPNGVTLPSVSWPANHSAKRATTSPKTSVS